MYNPHAAEPVHLQVSKAADMQLSSAAYEISVVICWHTNTCHTLVCMCVGCSSGREALCCSSKRAQRSCCGSSSSQQSTCQAAFGPTGPFQRPCCSPCQWGQQSQRTAVTKPNSLCYPAASSLTSCCCWCCAFVLKQCTMGCSWIPPTWAISLLSRS